MMKDNIFMHWFKELASLIFIQAIQAFIFAIVMSLIISVMTPENVKGVERSDLVAATGIIAVIALASISKLEELVKKIFGVQPSITDPGMRGGMKSLATTMMAANLAKGVLDNAGKVVGGIGGAAVANRKMNTARVGLAKKLKATEDDGTAVSGAGTGSTMGSGTAAGYLAEAEEARKRGDLAERDRKIAMAEGAANAGTAGGNSKKDDKKYIADAYDKYTQQMDDLKDQRRKSIFKAISGGTETIGAIGGGVTGMIVGAAAGEGKEIIQGGLVGIGAGDKLGGIPARAVGAAADLGSEISKISKERDNLVKAVEQMGDSSRAAVNANKALRSKYSKARAELDRQMQNFDISDL